MHIKLKYILPDIATCKKVRNALLLESIQEESIQFVAKSGTPMESLNIASDLDSTNMIHEGEKGLVYGVAFGIVSGIYVLTFPLWVTVSPAWYNDAPWFVIMGILILFGSLAMAFGATLLGVNIFNTDLNQYKQKIEEGEILMMLTVPLHQAHKMRQIIKSSLMDNKSKKIMLNQMKV
jgi:hypothetical protein